MAKTDKKSLALHSIKNQILIKFKVETGRIWNVKNLKAITEIGLRWKIARNESSKSEKIQYRIVTHIKSSYSCMARSLESTTRNEFCTAASRNEQLNTETEIWREKSKNLSFT